MISHQEMGQLLLHPLRNCGKLGTRDAAVNTETQPPSLEADRLNGRQVIHRHSRWAVYYKGEGQGGQERWPGGIDIEVETSKDDLEVSRVKEKLSETMVGMHISGRGRYTCERKREGSIGNFHGMGSEGKLQWRGKQGSDWSRPQFPPHRRAERCN